jgi:hypothetical protein
MTDPIVHTVQLYDYELDVIKSALIEFLYDQSKLRSEHDIASDLLDQLYRY